jgi:hypothetical protein
VFTSADLIEALRRRARRSLRPEQPAGEFPPGWQGWLDALSARLGVVSADAADAFIALLLEREPALPPRRLAELTRWQGFTTLWRQEWKPAPPEERGVRVAAVAITLVVHLLLAFLLLWAALVRLPPPGPAGEDVIQVEFIGEGTPAETGGAAPGASAPVAEAGKAAATPQPAQQRPSVATTAPPAAMPETSAPPAQSPAPSTPAPPETVSVQQPAPEAQPSPSPQQPLQVTEVATPDTAFTLPPPTPRAVEVPRLEARELQAEVREIQMVERVEKPVATLRPQLATGRLAAPSLTPDVAPVLPEVQARSVDTPSMRAPELQAPSREVTLRETAAPAPAPAAAAATSPARRPATASAAASSSAEHTQPAAAAAPQPGPGKASAAAPTANPSARSGTTPGAAAPSGAGPSSTRPGAWPTPTRGDDWDAAARNRPGGQAGQPGGLFNADGSPRLPPGPATPGGGLPPGTVTQDIPNLDRAGTWLKRPPVGYTPSRWDRFWVPNETLLEEWVRRNIRSVEIPIPGSTKKLHCVVSLLQLGGGCGISDPNLQDQEVEARPPPDVPFKPGLQEDQDALRKPAPR